MLVGGVKMNTRRGATKVRSYPKHCWHVVLAGTMTLAVLVGCAQTPEAEKTEMVPTPSVTYRFEDVPVPRSLGIDEGDSFMYESGAIKTGILVYTGKVRVGESARFFKEHMPTHGWSLVSNFERHDALLTFNKPGWICVISIHPAGMERSKVEVRVGPIESQ